MSLPNERDENEPKHEDPKLEGDWCNVILLTYMYVLQCIPRGMAQAVPLILQERKVTYNDQAGFSLSQYPYCFKVLWSPIVDSLYSNKMGRRKTWVIPTQLLMSLTLLILAMNIEDWLGSEDGIRKPKTQILALVFFVCTMFSATHDVALDGWAITMLKKRNVGHQASANNVGWALGVVLGLVLFLTLGSKEFVNFFRTVPRDHGFVKFSDFILFWSIVCLVSTVLIWFFKRERIYNYDVTDDEDSERRLGMKRSYKLLWQIMMLKPVQRISLIMFTSQVAFGPQMGVFSLKLLNDTGLSASSLAILYLPSLPLIVVASFVFSKHVTGYRCMRTFFTLYSSKIILVSLMAACVLVIPYVKDHVNNSFPTWYYSVVFILYNVDLVMDCMMWISSGSFYSRVSDPRFGGMYMAFFNVVQYVGSKWLTSLNLWLVDPLTITTCAKVEPQNVDKCEVVFDGYFGLVIVSSIFGIVWLFWAKKEVDRLEKLAPSAWKVQIEPTERSIVREQIVLNSTEHDDE